MLPNPILSYPLVLLVISVVVLSGSAWIGASFRKRKLEEEQREGFGIILGATLTLLALIIGFSFSMASNRYDLRKSYEEDEANAIGTEFVRAELLPRADTAKVDGLLRMYLNERISFYTAHDYGQLQRIDARTAALQSELWSAVRFPAMARPTAVSALVLAGMNDVLNSQGYTQAAWWNRIPTSAWFLMAIIAIGANVLVGYNSYQGKGRTLILLIVPLLASIAFMLIADLDSPRGGLIRVSPQNLLSLSVSLHTH
jgi:hypothetical protein